MKLLTRIANISILSIAAMTACKDDADDIKSGIGKSKMEFDGREIDLTGGALGSGKEISGSVPQALGARIGLHNSGANKFSIYLFIPRGIDNLVGEYKYSAIHTQGTFNGYVSEFSEDGTDEITYKITAGKVSVDADEDIYKVIFDCTCEGGQKLKGYYQGKMGIIIGE